MIDVFTRAITLVRREGLARSGAEEGLWPQDRRIVVEAMQRRIQATNGEVTK